MKRFWPILLAICLITTLWIPGIAFAKGPPAGGGGGEEPTAGNNLSFPTIAVDSFAALDVIPPTELQLTVPYTGPYTGLSAEELAIATSDEWYAQKTEGNVWQADFRRSTEHESVTYIDWGDNIESVNPKLGAPFRLEITLYQALVPNTQGETLTQYQMAILAFPSSPNEVQGTNGETFEGDYATVISTQPKLGIQYLGGSVPEDLIWDGTQWVRADTTIPVATTISFAPELNVAGKYIYGASQGGWKPANTGYYRITFHVPDNSTIDLSTATINNYPFSEDVEVTEDESETGAAIPVVVGDSNLSYVDVLVVAGGSRRPK